MTKHSISLHLAIAIPVIAVNDRMASNLSLIIAHGICDEVDPLGRVTAAAAAGHSHLRSLAAAESKPSLSVLQTWDTFFVAHKNPPRVSSLSRDNATQSGCARKASILVSAKNLRALF